MENLKIVDGNEACAMASYFFTEVAGIYPITPSSRMATLVDKWSSEGKKNLFNDRVSVIEMQSEAGASGVIHGALQAGSLSTTYTASQGLLLMIPSMYKMAGEMLPSVIHVAARSLSTHALSIFGDHQDIYACRSTGYAILSSSNVQDAYNLALVAHLSSIKSSIPFLHFFDGFRTSHEINQIKVMSEEDIKSIFPYEEFYRFKNKSLNLGKVITRGTSQTEDVYFENTEARNSEYNDVPDIVLDYMNKVNELMGTDYKPFNYYGSRHAKHIIIAMGSVTDTIKLVIDELLKEDMEVGLINVHLYRPFSLSHFLRVLPKSVEKITVLDRTKEAGSLCEPLYLDVCAALKNENIEIVGGRYGLSSKDTTPSMIKAVVDNMDKHVMKDHFTLGIIDDVTDTNLDVKEFVLSKKYKEIKVFGFGSDGMVSASKNILKVMGKSNYVQGYFEYDSKKSGGITISHLRLSNELINAPFYLTSPNLVVVSKDSYLSKYEVLDNIKQNGILLINTDKTDDELNLLIKDSTKRVILDKNIKVFVTKASELANRFNLKGKINNIMSYYILKILGAGADDILRFKDNIKELYIDKGMSVVNDNIRVLDKCIDNLRELDNSVLVSDDSGLERFDSIYDKMMYRRGLMVRVSDFINHKDGTFEGNMSKSDKRKISDLGPLWCKDNCIQCNLCSFICPHGVIKPFSMTKEEFDCSPLNEEDVIKDGDRYFYLGINVDNCTGCTLCSKVCPGKNKEKALIMDSLKDRGRDDLLCDYLRESVKNETGLAKTTVKGLGFCDSKFLFPGACAGCGETVYLRTLTSMYGDEIVISNATGCSSIYSSSLPCTPYKMPWISSLFEDNAEFGLGLHLSYKNQRSKIKRIMNDTIDEVSEEVRVLFRKWLDNMNDFSVTNEVKNELVNSEISSDLKMLIDYVPARKVWIVGGDGWAYDIGFGGLDHVLRMNENVKVLVLDTEVYSNTGGQTSKSTRVGAVAEFSNSGKLKPKKDLFQIAMNIPNCYVASISAGASQAQTVKAFMEAENHNGPSVIIAYSPCIAHGIMGGLSNSIEEQKLLVESGYNILMRYNPVNDRLIVDSKEPNFNLYETVFEKEMRYKNLERINPNEYERLYRINMNSAKKRYEYYLNISKKEVSE